MTTVRVTRMIPSPPEKLWGILRSFRLDYFPGYPHTVTGEGPGTERSFKVPGGPMAERITALDDDAMSLSYEISVNPWPVTDYLATITVSPAEDGAEVAWSADFEPVGAEEAAIDIVDASFGWVIPAATSFDVLDERGR